MHSDNCTILEKKINRALHSSIGSRLKCGGEIQMGVGFNCVGVRLNCGLIEAQKWRDRPKYCSQSGFIKKELGLTVTN
jgi:hypothetical protein